ncbi:MAG: alkylation response protein AidB-like acyl-CoA dehydrogenase [Gammaproteobacteria bacterium]|jgi:alkylation response protein AidB-like acyl-CoA dehydrogenase
MKQIEASLASADRAFLGEVRSFLDENLAPNLVAADDEQRMFFGDYHRSNAWLEKLRPRKWHVADWPQEYGGCGLSAMQNYLLLYEQGLRGAPFVRPMGLKYVGLTVMQFGNETQKQEILPRLINGDDHWCQGFSEPGAGSDLGNVKTFAERRGDVYVVNGSKIWTTDAHFANKIFCLVRTRHDNSKEALSFVLIDMNAPGVSVQPIRMLGGDHELNQVFFDDVEVFPEQMLGPEGSGWAVAKYLLEIERGAFVLGGRLRRRLQGVSDRARVGRTSARVWDRIAETEIDLMAYEATELRLGHLAEEAADVLGAANIIKIEWTELVQRIDELAVMNAGSESLYCATHPRDQVYADNGDIEMFGWLASYFNNRATSIYGGSNEIQRNLVYRTMKRRWI